MLPLTRLVAEGRSADRPVSLEGGAARTWGDLSALSAGLASKLSAHAPGRWLLSCASSFDFAVGLLALWRAGHVPVLPANNRPGTLASIPGELRGWVHDGPGPGGAAVLAPTAYSGVFSSGAAPARDAVALELFTSGTTGDRKSVFKTFAQLEDELSVLEEAFGSALNGAVVHATVSHQHIYGLLFRLLWPLCAGRPFAARTVLLWEDLLSEASGDVCLVSSPAHLDRAEGVDPVKWDRIRCKALFSSGGPLSAASAAVLRARTGAGTMEVLGSTETGGVAWRMSGVGGEAWTPFVGVSLSLDDDGRLLVFSSVAGGGQVLGDRASLRPDGKFLLLGRADRIVKVAEKRVSLDEMECFLRRSPWVKDVLLVPLDAAEKLSLGAVVRLTTEGTARLAAEGRSSLSEGLKEHLSSHFDPVTRPRYFRYVEDYPRDAQGKTAVEALKELFQPVPEAPATSPELLSREFGPTSALCRFRVPENLVYLDGHFPSFPLVAGVVQASWVLETAAAWLGRRPVVRAMDALKFKDVLLPGRAFSLSMTLARKNDGEKLLFSIFDGDVVFSSGSCTFE